MADSIDIYDWEKKLESVVRRLESSNIIENNKQLILQFHKQLIAEGLGAGRQAKVIRIIWAFAEWIKKPFDTLDRNDIVDLVGFIETQKWTARTKHDYKIMLKRFIKWLKNSKDYPDEVSWIKAPYFS